MSALDMSDVSIAILPHPQLSMIWKTNYPPFAFFMPDCIPYEQRDDFAKELAAVYVKYIVGEAKK